MNWGKSEIRQLAPSLFKNTEERVYEGYTLRQSKAYAFEKIVITKCKPFDYVIAETCRVCLIATPHYKLEHSVSEGSLLRVP